MCDKKPDCFNSKTLVLDTNFLDQINRTVRVELGSDALGRRIEEQRPIFLTRVQKIVENIGRCGGDHIFTSEKVYDDEIDISKLNSALRSADPEFFDNLCMDAGFIRDLSEIYLGRINTEELSEEEVQAFQEILSENVGFADAGLALLALNLSQDKEIIVITDDLVLRKAIEDLRRKQRITFGGDSLTTENLNSIGSLIFLKNLHFCCEVSNDRWRAVIWSFAEHQIKRYDKGEISPETYQEHRQYADQCIAQMLADCEAKKHREERDEYYKLFGVSDE